MTVSSGIGVIGRPSPMLQEVLRGSPTGGTRRWRLSDTGGSHPLELGIPREQVYKQILCSPAPRSTVKFFH